VQSAADELERDSALDRLELLGKVHRPIPPSPSRRSIW
jgi:hypothetical protein